MKDHGKKIEYRCSNCGDTIEELEEIRRKKIEQLKKWEKRKQEEAERKAYDEAHKNDCKEAEQAIMRLLDE